MRLVVLLLASMMVACGGESLREADGKLHVSAEPIEFPRTFVGYASERQVFVTSGSRVPKEFRVSTAAPFGVDSTGKVEGGRDGVATVTFTPEVAGRFEGILLFELGDVSVPVTLRGVAEIAPPCAPSAACRIVHFDEETGECTERVAPDGSSCAGGDECLVDQICDKGVCLGAPRDCDDGDVCTRDDCDSKRGCLAIDESAACPQSDDPCKAAYCDAVAGCGIADAPDGTPCGPGNCVSASICWVGTCTVVDVPDGTPCTAACGKGACANKECVRPDGNVLKQTWSRTMASGVELVFPGIGDPSGNLYWAECGASCELVSVEPKGHVRFRWRIPGGRVEHPEQILLEDGTAYVIAGSTLSSGSTFDGEIGLVQDLREDLDGAAGALPGGAGAACPCIWSPGSLASDGAGGLWIWMVGTGRDSIASADSAVIRAGRPGVLLSVDAGTGEVRRHRAFADVERASTLVVDRNSNVFTTIFTRAGEPLRISLSPDGEERWSFEAPGGAIPLASSGELLLEDRPRAVRGESGFLSYDLPAFPSGSAPSIVASATNGYVLGVDATGARLVGFQPATGLVVQDGRLAHVGDPLDWTRPVLTSRNGALFAVTYSEEEQPSRGGNRPEAVVREAAPDGSEARACVLPGHSIYGGPTFLRSGAWTVVSRQGPGAFDTVHQFELPKADTSGSGWVNSRGSLSGNGRPQ